MLYHKGLLISSDACCVSPVQQGALNNHPAGESSGQRETSAQIYQNHEGIKRKE